MLVFEEGKPEYPEKNLSKLRDENQQQTQPHMTPSPRIEPAPHWWEASALITALLCLDREKYYSFGLFGTTGIRRSYYIMYVRSKGFTCVLELRTRLHRVMIWIKKVLRRTVAGVNKLFDFT